MKKLLIFACLGFLLFSGCQTKISYKVKDPVTGITQEAEYTTWGGKKELEGLEFVLTPTGIKLKVSGVKSDNAQVIEAAIKATADVMNPLP